MTPAQEDFALRSCHPLYREWCREEEDDYGEEDKDYEDDYDAVDFISQRGENNGSEQTSKLAGYSGERLKRPKGENNV